MEILKVFEWVVANGGPSFVIACGVIWYMDKQVKKKEGDVVATRVENKALVGQVIEGQEKRLLSESEQRGLLKSLIEKNGTLTSSNKESFARMEANQVAMMAEIRDFKEKH